MFKTCYRQGPIAVLFFALLILAGPAFAQNNTQSSTCPGDFNGDGKINFQDYLLFVDVYDTSSGDANYNALMDLDGNGKIEFPDYLLFLDVYDTVCEATDRAVLATLYEATDGDNWKDNTNWLSDKPLREWFGVIADINGRVIFLNLSANQLSGSIPPELGNLSNLTFLDLYENQLSGAIPSELGNLSNLTFLNLGANQLSGAIPSELGNLSKLESLSLHANQVSGTIPAELGDLSNLKWLDLSQNQLSGTIPSELGDLTNLEGLGLSANQLSGAIPAELGNLSNLTHLDLGTNQLSGAIPSELSNLSNLTRLDLSANQLSGSIPPELGDLSNLTRLSLRGNQLSGCVPEGMRNVDTDNSFALGLPFCGEKDETTDRAALVALYNATDGDNWKHNTNWLSDRPLGEWFGVAARGGRVRSLNFQYNDLSGTIPPELGDLSELETLIILSTRDNDNRLKGPIPSELGNLSNLEYLNLQGNGLSGAIPPELGKLSNLTWLYLGGNNLSGAIPPELGNLSKLTDLSLSFNQLSGCVPEGLRNVVRNDIDNLGLPFCDPVRDRAINEAALVALYNATDGDNWKDNTNWLSDKPLREWHGVRTNDNEWVTSLELSGNGLSDSIPPELGNLAYLTGLNLSGNQLSGAIPVELGNLSNLTELNLSGNQLSGTIPAELGNLSNLKLLGLSQNQLSGAIPVELGNLAYLTGLELASNQLSGAIPAELGNLSNLTGLNLSGNQLSGTIPSELGKLSNLTGLNLSGNQLSGTIPSELGKLSNLTGLELRGNQLSGCVPEGMRNVDTDNSFALGLPFCEKDETTDRAVLWAVYEAMDGDKWPNKSHWLSDEPLSRWAGVYTDNNGRVIRLFLGNIPFSGSIPPELGKLSELQVLRIGNRLTGSIPPELGKLTNLAYLELHHNQLTGPIPPELGKLTNLKWLVLDKNQLSGSIPPELGNLTNLEWLILGNNQLSGSIPPELGKLSNLTWLDLHFNQLSGTLPSELGDLSRLEYMWLIYNQLNGSIPSTLGNLWSLKLLDLSANQLSGSVPSELGNMPRLEYLWLGLNNLTDIPVMGGLHSLKSIDIRGNAISRSSIDASFSAIRRDAVTLYDHPISESDYDIELVFLNERNPNRPRPIFNEFQKQQVQYATDRWMSIIREDRPDYTLPRHTRMDCGDLTAAPRIEEHIDDLRIYMNIQLLNVVEFYIAGVKEEFKPAALAGPLVVRVDDAGIVQPIVGCIQFDRGWVDKPSTTYIDINRFPLDPIPLDPMPLIAITLHEMAHVLGIGTQWSKFIQRPSSDLHFNGPLAIAAFDAAGGQNYTGAKIPIEPDGAHWRAPILSGEIMGGGRDRQVSAITIQALADLGYVVDVSQADPYTLPMARAGKITAFPYDWMCGGQMQGPVYMVDQQGRVIRTLSH